MRHQALESVLRMEDFEVMGFTDVLMALPKLMKHFYLLRNEIVKRQPALVILIDYPGFNLRLAKALRRQGYQGKIIQYICPSVWAHGQDRIQQLADSFDLLLTILPFEASYFKNTALQVSYVGNPLVELLSQYSYQDHWKEQYGISKSSPLVAVFPGSRSSEVKHNLPLLLEAAVLLKKEFPDMQIGLSCAHDLTAHLAAELGAKTPFRLGQDLFLIRPEHSYELMRDARCAMAKSGTVCLELALHACPTVVIYYLSALNRLFAKYLLKVKLPHYALPNIIAGERVFPEWIEQDLTPQNIYTTLKPLVEPTSARNLCLKGCSQIKAVLSLHTASQSAAQKIKETLAC